MSALRLGVALLALAGACTPPIGAPAPDPPMHPRRPPLAAPAPPPRMPARLLRTLAHRPRAYDPAERDPADDLLLGDLLFHSPEVLGPAAQAIGMSCNTCHPNGAAHPTLFLSGLSDRPGNVDLSTPHFRSGADDGMDDPVNVPSLRGARYTAPYGRDGRTASLAEFVQGVVSGEFGGATLPPARLAALVRYVNDLDFLPNKDLDAIGRLSPAASEPARRGERLFHEPRPAMAGRSCASCHVPSSYFRDGEVHRLGSGDPASPYALDDGFETPTLLGTAEAAPYFHDGRLATLADVVAWFDDRFGLRLATEERADLTAYLAAVGAVEPAADDRPLAQRMVETFAYLSLLTAGGASDDRAVWQAALALAGGELARAPVARPLAPRISAAQARIERLARRCREGASLPPLRDEVRDLHRDLTRLAADLAGALASR